ncbi:uncharacterized protein UTRI_01331_B [Ustilago trichophora]|uniref:PH domain-containing protein n=1 Tax=Ustilago trichophora TaxID=86804 RepID=A0A5C3DUF1_9BASI|nr:uncharacterized protein UTRI_01331_B [Ustilago trichophora]
MMATSNGSTFDSSVRTAVSQLQQADCRYDHIVLAAAEASTSRSAPLHLIETAAGGLDALRSKLRTHDTRFALLRVQSRLLLVISLGQNLTGLKRAQVLVQGRALQSSLGAALFAAVTIANASQLTSALVGSKLQLDGFAHITSPNIAQDFRASWSSNSATSVTTRAKPSAPSSPEELGHDATWSRPVSDVGPSYRSSDQKLSTPVTSRAKSFHSSLFIKLSERGYPGIVIDLESVVETPKQNTEIDSADVAPVPPPKTGLPALPACADDSEGTTVTFRASSTPTAASLTEQALQNPIQLRKQSDLETTRSPREWLTTDERKRLSDERERIRVDEAIRDEVMKKLRAEQHGLLRSPANRTPRPAISPPLAPPPSFAPPPAPSSPSPSAAASPSTRPSSIHSPRLSSRNRLEDEVRSTRTLSTETLPSTRNGSRSPRLEEPVMITEDVRTLTASLSDASRTSESHESIRSSIQSLSLWEFAEEASQRASFLSLPGQAPSSNINASSFRAERPASEAATPSRFRSRQPSCSESVASVEQNRCAASSSTGSVAASSIFDKELPAPPAETENGSADGEEWTGALGSPDSMTHPLAPWIEPSSKLLDQEQESAKDAEGAEMQDLRDRLAQAEARAKAAEEAANVAVREARSETRRLAEELAHVERGAKDKMEAEAIRRAKWAREQVARDQLDAYERSKLEAAEKRRRRAIEEQRRLECDRANRIREEQEWREQEAERIKQEYELKIQHLAEREAKLKAEAEAREQRESERIEQERARASYRQSRLSELKKAMLEESDTGAPLLQGWLNLQVEGAMQWKRRWYQVSKKQLILTRSSTDSSLKTVIPLDPIHLLSIRDQHEDCTMSHSLCLEVRQTLESELDQAKCTYLLSTDTRAAKEEIELVVEAIASS